jgi:hypothetical protein
LGLASSAAVLEDSHDDASSDENSGADGAVCTQSSQRSVFVPIGGGGSFGPVDTSSRSPF